MDKESWASWLLEKRTPLSFLTWVKYGVLQNESILTWTDFFRTWVIERNTLVDWETNHEKPSHWEEWSFYYMQTDYQGEYIYVYIFMVSYVFIDTNNTELVKTLDSFAPVNINHHKTNRLDTKTVGSTEWWVYWMWYN